MQGYSGFTEPHSDLFEAIVAQAPDVIIFADCEGAIRVWNHGAESVFGYAPSEVLGDSLDVIIPERLRKAHWDGFHKAIDSGQTKYRNKVLTTRSVHGYRFPGHRPRLYRPPSQDGRSVFAAFQSLRKTSRVTEP